jgi:predicted esterase YcpF (UPF0227 family)
VVKLTIVYFHGFNSNSNTEKVGLLKKAYPEADVIAPNIPFASYNHTYNYLKEWLKEHLPGEGDIIFVGTSLGGYWCHIMAEEFGIQAVVINPCLSPKAEIAKLDNKKDASTYPDIGKEKWHHTVPKVVLLAKDDEVFDHTKAQDLYKDKAGIVTQETGGHRMNDINSIVQQINHLLHYDYV